MQVCTQMYGRRPYGVGMLVAGYDVSACMCKATSTIQATSAVEEEGGGEEGGSGGRGS